MANAVITNVAGGFYNAGDVTRTFTLAIGAADPARWVIPVVIYSASSVKRDMVSCTVNGIDAFLPNSQLSYIGGGLYQHIFFGRPVYVPEGTTTPIAATVDKSFTRIAVIAVACTGITGNSARRLVGAGGSNDGSAGVAIDTYAGGLTLAAMIADDIPAITWSGVEASPGFNIPTNTKGTGGLRTYSGHPDAETAHAIKAMMPAAYPNALAAASYAYDDNSATPSTVSVNDFTQNEILQRVIGTKAGNIKVKGAYTGTVANTPTRVQGKVVRGAATVLDWTDMTGVSIAGGYITGFLPGVPVGFVGYQVQLRTYVGTTLLATSALTTTTFGVGDVVAVGGSSTASMFCAAGAVNEPNPANSYRMDRLTVDANGNGVYASNNLGGGVRAIGNRLRALEPDVPIAFLDLAVTGSKLEAWVNAGDGNRVALTDYITKHQGIVACFCVPFLATDVTSDVATNVSRFTTLISQVRTACNQPTLPVFLSIGGQTDDANGPVAADYGQVQATIQMELSDANVTSCSYRDRSYSTDGTHMTPAGVEHSGTRLGTQMAGVMRASGRAYKCPKPLSRTYDPATGAFVVTFDLRGANSLVGLTGQSNITGFTASPDGFATLLTITSAVIVAPNQVRVVVAEKPASAEIAYFQGKHPDNTNSLCSNTSIVA
jgi:hypothetical protein